MTTTAPLADPCPTCGAKNGRYSWHTTLVGYQSPEGHVHDGNCWGRLWWCENGHAQTEIAEPIYSRACPACGWRRDYCGAHRKALLPLPSTADGGPRFAA